ncbi:hypothetical protein Rhopal_003944-T1 [Rhodotorula paludigena]|uniref:Proteophosphoglycan ppg4 n=1 Tax=Rhodotorula paludigena TaxID=86838 RepID=A0AAV5GN36_9BASI|nr:hypothetical protein Rhopal_003944-T1 [Rhodotorula paludigena]
MTAAPRHSRIPRSALGASAAANENAPVQQHTQGKSIAAKRAATRVSAIPLAPASTLQPDRDRALAKSASQATLRIRKPSAAVEAREDTPSPDISVQHPSSDRPVDEIDEPLSRRGSKTRFDDEQAADEHVQMPTPPNSQSPPAETAMLAETSAQDSSTRSRSTSAQPKAAAPASRRTSRSPSITAADAIPTGPSHAPHVLAARRRSSISPLPPLPAPPAASTSTSASSAPAPGPSARSKKKGSKSRPRPSEILPVAPLLDAASSYSSSDEDDDPLRLLGPEQTRGRGEGKRRTSHHPPKQRPAGGKEVRWSAVPLSAEAARRGRRESQIKLEGDERLHADDSSGSVLRSTTASPASERGLVSAWSTSSVGAAAARDTDEPHMPYQSLFGDLDVAASSADSAAQFNPLPTPQSSFVAQADAAPPVDPTDLGGFDGHDAYLDQALPPPSSDAPAAGDDMIGLGLGGLGDLSQFGQSDSFVALQDPSSGSEFGDDTQEPALEQDEPSDDEGAAGDEGEMSFSYGFGAPRRTRPSYPPLSPNRTGEFDTTIAVRLQSSPVRGVGVRESSGSEEDDVEASRGRSAKEWREVKVEVDEQEPEQLPASTLRQSTPLPSSVEVNAASTPRPTISTPSNLLFSAIRAPSPALSALSALRSPHPSATPQLDFASPRVARGETLAHLLVSSPGLQQKSWTRGPAFFRSSTSPTVSPAPSPRLGPRKDQDEEQEEVALGGRERTALERSLTRGTDSLPDARGEEEPEADVAPPTPAKDRLSPVFPATSADEDERMASPAQSLRLQSGAFVSPARSASGDMIMSSPSPRPASPALSAHSLASPSVDRKKLPSTPGQLHGTDMRMASPSPARAAGSPLKARLGAAVEEGRSKLQGLLFGPRSAPEPSREDEDDEQPFAQPVSHPQAPASLADSTFTSRSDASFFSNATMTSSNRRRRRSRPSHPTLPVIEVSSTDPRAAARAAAILKVYHKYVEQGVEAVDAAEIAHAEIAAAEHDEADDEEEEELRTLLLDAEDELREHLPPARKEDDEEAPARRWTSREWRKLEQTLVELGRRQRRGTSVSSMGGVSMASESIALASVTGEDVDAELVVETFLRKVGVARKECESAATSARSQPAPPSAASLSAERASTPVHSDDNDAQEGDEQYQSPELIVKQEHFSDEDELRGDDDDCSDEDASGDLADDTFFAAPSRDRRARRTSIAHSHLPTALANPALRHLYEDTPPEKPKVPIKDFLRDESPASSQSETSDSAPFPCESTPDNLDAAPKSPSSAQRLFSYLGSFVRRSPAPAPVSPSSTRALRASSPSSPAPEMQQVQLSTSLVTPQFASTSKPFPPVPSHDKPLPHISERKILPLPPSHFSSAASSGAASPVASTSRVTLDAALDADSSNDSYTSLPSSTSTSYRQRRRNRRSSGETGRVWEAVQAIEEAESSREEEDSRIISLLQSGGSAGAKRRAAEGDLRRSLGADDKGKGKAREIEVEWRGYVEIDRELDRMMIPSGTRATDRRVSGERRASRQ